MPTIINAGNATTPLGITGGNDGIIKIQSGTTLTDAVTIDAAQNVTHAGATTTSGLTVAGSVFGKGDATKFKNRIINGDMRIDQRNSGAAQSIPVTAVAYTVDRWFVYGTGAVVTGQQVAGTLSPYHYQITGAAGITQIAFGQRIESYNIASFAGKTVTISVNLSNSLLTTVGWNLIYPTSQDNYSTVTQFASGSFNVTATETRYSFTTTIPTNVANGLQVQFFVDAQTSGTWTIGNVQLEEGSVSTDFDIRDIGTELALCKRYWESVPTTLGSNGDPGYYFFYKVSKRVVPTITWSAATGTLTSLSSDVNVWNGFSTIARQSITLFASAEL